MVGRHCGCLLLIYLVSLALVVEADEQPTDQVCELLFEGYIARQVKINTDTIRAAEHIVAERGRGTGFWKIVLAKLKANDPANEIGCVRVLGKMLATDASEREAIRRQKETGEISAHIPHVYLGPEVVAELIERGKKADRFRIDHYTVALARARAPEARDFFTSILNEMKPDPVEEGVKSTVRGPYHMDTTRFHAAVGLAHLGDPLGVEWLIENCEFGQGTVSNAKPLYVPLFAGTDLNACCLAALQELYDKRDLTSKSAWEAWWKTADKERLANHVVHLTD
ncbi:MAG: hypothetical protein WD648_09030 [Planctomycetaceae bacterium]